MAGAADLYRTIVLAHGKRPRNVGRLPDASHAADGDNPLCGDAIHVAFVLRGDMVAALCFDGECCVLATASASLMTERVAGASVAEARHWSAVMEALCARGPRAVPADVALGDLRAFGDVHRHPARVACALLPWRTLVRALGD